MSHIRIDKSKAVKKWAPVLENMGVAVDRVEWMSEMAEYHSINENAYVNASSVAGMGNVLGAQPSTLAGSTINAVSSNTYNSTYGNLGSGDVGQNLLPVAMKIAAQTIGLDLVAVKPTPGPKIDLLYIDFQYDDIDQSTNERPQVFKLATTSQDSSIFTALSDALPAGASLYQGGVQGGRLWSKINSNTSWNVTAEPVSKQNYVEFLGFSRIDSLPIFRAYRQTNSTSIGSYNNWFDASLNTFGVTASMVSQITNIAGLTVSGTPTISLVSAL